MRPSFSVIIFTVLSGAGYGLWIWLGLALALNLYPRGLSLMLVPLTAGMLLVSIGLLSSTLHLGKPMRAWRGVTQWRSSWLSREAVAALLSYLPMLALVMLRHELPGSLALRLTGFVLAACACTTVFCTARIYTSLKPIPAWRKSQVLPGFLLLALASGGLWLWCWLSLQLRGDRPLPNPDAHMGYLFGLLLLLALAAWLKRSYWRTLDVDQAASRAGPGPATGLDRFGAVRAAEAPHSEENYLLREMGFVMARRHRQALRSLCLLLAFILPMLLIGTSILLPQAEPMLAWIAVVVGMTGLLLERWLFFAEARHLVISYYGKS